jgi:hypothetical protein
LERPERTCAALAAGIDIHFFEMDGSGRPFLLGDDKNEKNCDISHQLP